MNTIEIKGLDLNLDIVDLDICHVRLPSSLGDYMEYNNEDEFENGDEESNDNDSEAKDKNGEAEDILDKVKVRNKLLSMVRRKSRVRLRAKREEDRDSETHMFRRIYVCLGALKIGFKAHGREMLGLDGTFMRGQYPRQLLTTVGVDAYNGIYPMAYGIVESESQHSWTWVLNCRGDDLDLYSNSNFTFIANRKKGLLSAIAKLFPVAKHSCLNYG
ncbi:FAR1-related sequence 10 [Tanacetum coccineum]